MSRVQYIALARSLGLALVGPPFPPSSRISPLIEGFLLPEDFAYGYGGITFDFPLATAMTEFLETNHGRSMTLRHVRAWCVGTSRKAR